MVGVLAGRPAEDSGAAYENPFWRIAKNFASRQMHLRAAGEDFGMLGQIFLPNVGKNFSRQVKNNQEV